MSDAPADAHIFVEAEWRLTQSFRRDKLQQAFFDGLKEKRLLGVVDPGDGAVLFPPRAFSERSFQELSALRPVGPGGVIRTLTRIPGGRSGRPPLTVVYVQLDGAASASPGHLRGTGSDSDDPVGLIGARCTAVFKEAPVGAWDDYWFELA